MTKSKYFRKEKKEEPKKDDVVMKQADLDALVKAAKEENQEEVTKIFKTATADMEKNVKEAIQKEMATRKTQEDTGLDANGEASDFLKSLEKRVGKSELNEWTGKLTDFEKELRYRNDQLVFLSEVNAQVKRPMDITKSQPFQDLRRLVIGYNDGSALAKAWDNTAGNALEYIPVTLSSRLTEKMEVELQVANQFERIALPSAKHDVPRVDGFPTAFKGVIRTATTESTVDTDKSSFVAVKGIAESRIAYESDEDSIIASMPLAERQITMAIARGVDRAIINGDDSGTHMDADTEAVSNDFAKSWKGLRKLSIDNSFTFDVGGVWTLAKFRIWVNKLNFEFGSRFNELRLFFGKDTFNQIRGLSDVTTVEKIGSVATILNGELRALDGIPIIPSQHVRDDLNNNGKFVATASAKGSANLVHPNMFGYGTLGGMTLETDRDISKQEIIIVGSIRSDFKALMDPTLHGYNTAINITLV